MKVPSELLTKQCEAVRHGDGSVKQLVNSYIENLGCIRKNEVQLEQIIKYNNEVGKTVNRE